MRKAKLNSKTKEKLLVAAQRLMLTKGFTATTVDEICEESGLTKGSFFHYFESKESLGKAVLDRYVSLMFQTLQTAPFLKESDPLQRIFGYLDFVITMSRNPEFQNGCLLGNFAQVLSDTHPEIRSLCVKHFNWWAEVFKRDIDEARGKYASKTSIDTKSLAEHFIAVFEGSLILAKAMRDVKIIERNLNHFKQYLKSLFGNIKKGR